MSSSLGSSVLNKEEALELRKQYVSPSLSLHYSSYNPLKIVRGEGVYFYDENDDRYIDCINNVALVGHSHPRLVEAMKKQMTNPTGVIHSLSTDSITPTKEQLNSYCSKILSTLPGSELDTLLFVRSGSEANDLALTLAEAYTGHTEFIVLDGAYHGHSKDLLGLSTYKKSQEKVPGSFKPNIHGHIASLPDMVRGKYRDPTTAGELYAKEIKEIIDKIHSEGKKLAAFMCESFLGCAGQVPLPDNYLKAVMKYVHNAGGVCIIDEVQTGFGRCGEHFWVHQTHKVHPDMLTMGKPMGNGHPISAVATRMEIIAKFVAKYGHELLPEFMSDPVSIAIAETQYDIVIDEQLQKNALNVGDYIMGKLRLLKDKHNCIGDVRGVGLFIGVLIVDSGGQPDPIMTKAIVKRVLLDHHVMLKEDGLDENIIKIKPPLCFTMENADVVVMAIDQSIIDIKKTLKS